MSISFYSQKEKPYGCFSNFSNHSFNLDGKQWRTSEHYFQANKFIGTEYYDKVHQAETPREAFNLGRDKTLPIRKDWESAKEDIMRKALYAKFTQNQDIKNILLSTGKNNLIENSPVDYYWGIGEDGKGKNRLGFLLMELREKLNKESN